MAMTTDGDWGLDVVYEAPDGLRPDMLLPESLPDIENAERRSVCDKNRSSVFTLAGGSVETAIECLVIESFRNST